jgi:nicotinate phosphoribosyltransferase
LHRSGREPARSKAIPADATHEDLLVPIFEKGKLVYEVPTLAESQGRTHAQLANLNATSKRFVNPHTYPAGIERALAEEKARLVEELRARNKV